MARQIEAGVEQDEVDLGLYARMLWRHRHLVAGAVLVSVLVSTLAPAVYESETVVMVGQNPFQPVPTDSLAAFATLPSVTDSIVERVPGVRMTSSMIRNTPFLKLRVRGGTTDVARVANEWAAAVAAQSRATFALSPEHSPRVIAPAVAATRRPPSVPLTATIALAGFVGLATGVLAAFVVEALRPGRAVEVRSLTSSLRP